MDTVSKLCYYLQVCTRSIMDRTEASDAFDAGSIPVGCIFYCLSADPYLFSISLIYVEIVAKDILGAYAFPVHFTYDSL